MRFQSIRLFSAIMKYEYGYQTVGDTVLMFVLKQLNSPLPPVSEIG